MSMERGDTFGEATDSISIIVVTDVGRRGFRLAERYYEDDGSVNWTHYWCPPDEFAERPTNQVSSGSNSTARIAERLVATDDIPRVEREVGIRD